MNDISTTVIRLAGGVLVCACAAFISGCATAPRPEKVGKLNHVGLIWLKEPGNELARRKVIDAAHAFAREIPEVQSLCVGRPVPEGSPLVDTSFDLCLTMKFEDQAAMDRYAKHPVHLKAAEEVFLPLSKRIQFYDFIAE